MDIEAPASVRQWLNAGRICCSVVLALTFSALGVAQCYAQEQDVAVAARQERARKQNQQRKNKHIYTAEDLKREHILTLEDRAQMEAKKNHPAPPDARKAQDTANASAAREAGTPPLRANAPLGDVARRLRKQKESQKLERSAEFHLPFSDKPVLASPRPPAQPLRSPVATTTARPRVARPTPLPPHLRRSPFERPRVIPPASAVSAVRPVTPAPPASRVLPAQPRELVPSAPRVPLVPTIPPELDPPRPAPSVLTVPTPAGVAPPVSGKLVVVTVKPGDSLWKLAAECLGNGRRWRELLTLNPGLRNPNFIKAGSEVVLPVSVAPARAPTQYTVRQGDTLWTIAQTYLGHAASWACIAHTNPSLRDPNLLYEGQVLLLPASCPGN